MNFCKLVLFRQNRIKARQA